MQKDKYNTRTKKSCNFEYYEPSFLFPENKVTSVGIFVFQENGKIICIELYRGIDIPGGHLHVNETPIEALKRECFEEAFIEIKDIELVKVVESDYFGNSKEDLTYMLFYIGKVDKKYDFIKNEESFTRYELSPIEFFEKYKGNKDLIKNSYGKYLKK